MTDATINRVIDKVRIDVISGCWVWTGHKTKNGYGVVRHGGRSRMAHRVVYEHHFGVIQQGLQLDHLCRNRKCVYPFHLQPVTCRENVLRGFGPAALAARRTTCKHGHEYVSVAHANSRRKRVCRECSRAYYRAWRERKKALNG